MDYTNNPYMYGQYPNQGMSLPPNMTLSQPMQYTVPPQPHQKIDPRMFETPEITSGTGIKFNIKDEGKDSLVPVVNDLVPQEEKKKRGRPKKVESGTIVRSGTKEPAEKITGTVEDTPTEYTYQETSNMLRQTLSEIDALNGELVQEFTNVKHNKYMKNKYNTLVGLSENIGSLLNTKISAIRELNSSITKSNDMDFKKMKELKAAQQNMNDDKYISDLFQSFISNKSNLQSHMNLPPIDQTTTYSSGIVRAEYAPNTAPGQQDYGYMQYMANLTPEQNLMRYEKNPNVRQVVVFDASTGAKYFQYMDMSTGQAIPNMPVYDQMMMENTTLDIKNKIAKNNDLHETFDIVVINDNITSQY